ncbi:endolytic transglycosylase MltG [Desulfurobacterium sp.]
MKKVKIFLLFFAVVFFFVFLRSVFLFFVPRKLDVKFLVSEGESTDAVIERLADRKIIDAGLFAKLLARLRKLNVKAGKYRLSGSYSDKDILDILSRGQVHYVKFVVPEGYNLFDIAAAVGEKFPRCGEKSFLKLAFNVTFVHSAGFNSTSLEGFLFPDTYIIDEDATCSEVADAMISNFRKKVIPVVGNYTPPIIVRKALKNVSLKKLITVASIVEKETAVPGERPVIAGIIYKRLEKGMPLQCDPTVIYAYRLKGVVKKNLKGNDIQKVKSPYNTYRVKGLPPTPICNPGMASIEAALHPVDTPYLYFFAVNGRHVFSKTYREHLAKMRKYYNRRVR